MNVAQKIKMLQKCVPSVHWGVIDALESVKNVRLVGNVVRLEYGTEKARHLMNADNIMKLEQALSARFKRLITVWAMVED